ncbi:hypothetical protein [Rhodococcus sp. 06-235-1A]|uniref:hypothetical protein n=1 Tax=Rhodococcus sp. 06-235-1A TaxID=2022508 RepID=UPI00117A6EB6|nr:hypothetical protein [Rhodococcus sp. 06-235-1A]
MSGAVRRVMGSVWPTRFGAVDKGVDEGPLATDANGRGGRENALPDSAADEEVASDLDPVGVELNSAAIEMVHASIERTLDSQERRVTSIDQRGGVLLGFAGILVGIVLRNPAGIGVWEVAGAGLAGAAAIMAAFVIAPNTASGLNPEVVLEEYSTVDETTGRFEIASTLVSIYQVTEKRLRSKLTRLRITTGLLAGSVLVLLVAAIIRM